MIVMHGLAVAIASAALCGSGLRRIDQCETIVGDRWVHVVSGGESWVTIGARVGVDPAVLAARNGLNVRVPLQPGDVLGIDNRHIVPVSGEDGVIINIPQRMLFHVQQGAVRAHYPVAVGGRGWATPTGSFSIVAMESDPTWDVPVSIQEEMRRAGKRVVTTVPPGPENPLGKYFLRLSFPGIGLHGTTTPSSVYTFATHGCIRLHPDDIEELFNWVSVGEPGRIVYEPVLVAFDGTDVYLEVHPDPYGRTANPIWRALDLLDQNGLRGRVDLTDVVRVARDAEGVATPVTVRHP
jgi:L,D-transpeptidase ErfK/SrfK